MASEDSPSAGSSLPESTYRLQFHAGFTFRDATAIVPYLRELGITHCYASPYLKARAGSTHGYDIVDHNQLNPEIGSQDDFERWVAALNDAGLAHILDMVPNHAGVGTNDNAWWNDVLEDGIQSPFAECFDIEWSDPPRDKLRGKVLLPVLGSSYATALEKGELKLECDDGGLAIVYFDRRFPLSIRSYLHIVGDEPNAAGRDIVERTKELDNANHDAQTRRQIRSDIKTRLVEQMHADASLRTWIAKRVEQFNGTPGNARSFDRLDALLNAQHYRLAFWRVGPEEINYRRFFEINDLAALRMEREEVFASVHALVIRLLVEKKIAGLRIDHPDGLRDPEQYFRRLQKLYLTATGNGNSQPDRDRLPFYVVAEKILAADERLPQSWMVHGTSGYDFLAKINSLFADAGASELLSRIYAQWSDESIPYDELVFRTKKRLLRMSFAAELSMLAKRLDRLAQKHRSSCDLTLRSLTDALTEVISCFPVYRSYIVGERIAEADCAAVELAIREAAKRLGKNDRDALEFLRAVLLLRKPDECAREETDERNHFISKFQQLTAPVMAKGVEDTTFYAYNRLTSLNEVGGDPGGIGIKTDALHDYLIDRQKHWPHALSPLSTHDTKRSEDVRARINVLSELPDEWAAHARNWQELNAPHRKTLGMILAPAPNDAYLLYQTLLGAWPLDPFNAASRDHFVKRIQQYMQKALREAKVRTSWTDPNQEYESAVSDFVAAILDEAKAPEFLKDFLEFQSRISHFGLLNSLSQTLLRLTAPGVPDTYQGTELWDFSLVDPDNRRPVDYELRAASLRELKSRVEIHADDRIGLVREMTRSMSDGRAKLFVTWQSLLCRRHHSGLFSEGEYIPLHVIGPRKDHAFAFLRRQRARRALVIVPRLICRLLRGHSGLPVGADVWGETRVLIPEPDQRLSFRDVFAGKTFPPAGEYSLGKILSAFPVALLLDH